HHDHFDVQQINNRGERNAEEHAGALHHDLSHLVAILGGASYVFSGQFPVSGYGQARQGRSPIPVEPLPSATNDVGAGTYGLQAANIATGALYSLRIDCDMPEFPGDPCGAPIYLSVDYDASPYSRSERDVEDVATALRCAHLQLSICGGVGVIVYH